MNFACSSQHRELVATARQLFAYCQMENWAGWDPYDALNAKAGVLRPFLKYKFPRIALTQLLKRSPINFRAALRVPPTQNPKAIGLFLSALLKLSGQGLSIHDFTSDSPANMVDRLVALRSGGSRYWCWGYSFPWQGRHLLVPAGAPNLVCTTFVANALLDAYEHSSDSRCLHMAVSAAEYIVNDLYWSEGRLAAGFSYPLPGTHSSVHNANLLAAALLCRIFKLTGEQQFLDPALKAARYSASRQKDDGSWVYGEAASQQWVDNFHSGYNLCALRQIDRYLRSCEFDREIAKGLRFYKDHFLQPDGEVGYFHDRRYPIDIHCVAQTIITLLEVGNVGEENRTIAHQVFRWALAHMWDLSGFFYHRKLKLCTIRTPYMRWSEAWMCLAISRLLEDVTAGNASRSNHELFAAVS